MRAVALPWPLPDLVVFSPAPSRLRTNHSPALELLIGSCAFVMGCLVYVIDRGLESAWFVRSWMTAGLGATRFTGCLQGQAPDFLHVFAFTLVSSSLTGSSRRERFAICAGWWFLECVLELGQHPALSPYLVSVFGGQSSNGLSNHVCAFLRQGTFDWLDLVAFSLGSLSAYFTLTAISERNSS